MNSYETWTVDQLTLELKKRGMRQQGRKASLVERLRALDSMKKSQDPGLSYSTSANKQKFTWPTNLNFISVTKSCLDRLPHPTKQQLEQYVLLRQGHDRLPNNDLSALHQGQQLVETNVKALSFGSGSERTYFSGVVSASMKKKLSYNVRFIVALDGDFKNSECDCPAGEGPFATCKHFCAASFILIHLVSSNILYIEKSCTEELQNFHAPTKKHTGSPIKASALKRKPSRSGRKRDCIDEDDDDDDDPRPLRFRQDPNRISRVQMATVNFCSASNVDITMRYTFKKADI